MRSNELKKLVKIQKGSCHELFLEAIRKFKSEKKFTIQQSAAHLNVSYRTFQDWLAGNTPHPDRQQTILERIKNFKP
jgi:DNA-binding transcriptional regulator YiaG